MYYLSFGKSNRAIIFLHGWGADHKSFLWCNNYLTDEYLKIYVDFKGFGNSSEPNENYCLNDYVNDVKRLLDNFEIKELIIVGHSFGGRVAIKFAYLFGKQYGNFKLVLIDSAGLKPRRSFLYFYKIYRYKILKHFFSKNAKLQKKLAKMGSNDYKMLSNNMKNVFIKIVNEDLTNFVKKIKFDTIIIWGEKDKETKPYMAKKFNKLICNSKLFFLKDAGHFCFLDKPLDFLIILDTFIKNK